MKKKYDDNRARRVSNAIHRFEMTQPNSVGVVDREWDSIEETENNYAERLRTRGTF